jgi:phosphoglycolate phosphatase
MERLVVEEGADRGRHVDLAPGDNLLHIGRDPGAHLFLRDLRASHAHARLERRPDGVWVVDLKSHNGTFVNGAPVHEHRLHPGDHIRIGDSLLRWVWVVETGPVGAATDSAKHLATRLQAFYRDHGHKGNGTAMPAGQRRVIAFDIEGTLLTTNGLAAEALEQTLRESCGVLCPLDGFTTAGHSEIEIARNALRAAGLTPDQIRTERPRILSRYVATLGNALARRTPGRVLPGVKPLLDRLAADPGWQPGLFTRQIQLSARLLLGHFGLLGPFKFGVYADDAENPDALPGLLLMRAREASGAPLQTLDAWFMGSSVRLLAAARGAGMRTVAVATGVDTAEALAGQGPAILLRSLEDTEDVLRRINQATGDAGVPAAESTQRLTPAGGIGN